MFYKKPKSDSPKDLYDWALELCEMMNRSSNASDKNKKEEITDGYKNAR